MLPLSAKLFSRRGTYQLSQVSKLVPVKKNTAIHCCVLFFLVCTVKAVCISVCVCGSGRADSDHSAATVPGGQNGEQGGIDLQSHGSPWTELPVVQRQRGGQYLFILHYIYIIKGQL